MEKAHILQEIRRTAEANGGVPLGRLAFTSETRIGYHEWHGTYWVRWNDALREAGLPPNKFTRAYDDYELLERYVGLARELGRLPVGGDVRMKAHSDSAFPSEKTFRRFGGKTELVRRIFEYCQGREGYDDVVHMCNGVCASQTGGARRTRR